MQRTLLRPMLILSETQVRQCLNLQECLEANRQAFRAVAKGEATVPPRLLLPYNNSNSATADFTLIKPAATSTLMGCKVISIRGENPAKHGLPLAPGTILHLNAETGIVEAVLDATFLTAARTAAGSALATEMAWRNRGPLVHLVLFGAGLQARLHVQMIAEAIPQDTLSRLTIINRTKERALLLKKDLESMQTELRLKIQEIKVVELNDQGAVAESVSSASCVVTCTNTSTPLFDSSVRLEPGCHINSIGSYTPDMIEIPTGTTTEQCRVWIDSENALSVGDLKDVPSNHPITVFGKLLDGESEVEFNSEKFKCTFFKSVGTAIQDVLTADVVVKRARELGLGTEVDMT